MFARRLDLPEILHAIRLPQFSRFLFQHFAVSDDGIERCPQFVAHVRQECALRPAGLLRSVFGLQEFFLRFFSVLDLLLQFAGPGLQFLVRSPERRVPLLDFGQHGVKAIDQPSNFVAVRLGRAYLVIAVGRDHSHGVFQVQNRPGDQPLKF